MRCITPVILFTWNFSLLKMLTLVSTGWVCSCGSQKACHLVDSSVFCHRPDFRIQVQEYFWSRGHLSPKLACLARQLEEPWCSKIYFPPWHRCASLGTTPFIITSSCWDNIVGPFFRSQLDMSEQKHERYVASSSSSPSPSSSPSSSSLSSSSSSSSPSSASLQAYTYPGAHIFFTSGPGKGSKKYIN